MHQAFGIVMIILLALVCLVIGLFCLYVIEEELSNMRNGGGKGTPPDSMTDEEPLDLVRKGVI